VTTPWNEEAAKHLAKLCGMFGSNFAGERENAARLANMFVKSRGLTWDQVIRPSLQEARQQPPPLHPTPQPAEWYQMAAFCWRNSTHLNDKEYGLIASILDRSSQPTPKQMKWLRDITRKLGG
jgi:hypothetical protein